jgi:hypothetical protein
MTVEDGFRCGKRSTGADGGVKLREVTGCGASTAVSRTAVDEHASDERG